MKKLITLILTLIMMTFTCVYAYAGLVPFEGEYGVNNDIFDE